MSDIHCISCHLLFQGYSHIKFHHKQSNLGKHIIIIIIINIIIIIIHHYYLE